ncbi:hypothetical protein OAQ86_01550 [Candidatus Pseudothioglobus singularis]|nr:hypothetical protein [Candidatus Pseudothioglobus singularis]
MKLFIHIGLHKTGTTTFQTFLHLNRNALLKAGVFYPEMGEHESHWVLPNQLVRNNWDYVEDFMKSSFQTAKKENVETVFISSEDFELFLFEGFRASQLENLAYEIGYSSISWACILRNQWDYFNSLYSQLSKQQVSLNYATAGEAILNFGELSMNSKVYKWRYAFDYDVIIERFLNDIKGSFFVMSFDEFKSTQVLGRTLIDRVIDHKTKINSFWNPKLHFVEKTNIRGDGDTIEIDYLANFLGINMTKEIFEENKSAFLPIISNRLGMIDLVKEDLFQRFKERFPQVSVKFNLD